ncbi:hypothetical protein [Rubrobacter aplysinae]|uniref:hypothetical protein n=1 Tax=Rubrobacter aplysinae TaxID=909625 RepID=UPI00064BA2B2|nr:hypothetical protein [Rubrobacter aplysinae]
MGDAHDRQAIVLEGHELDTRLRQVSRMSPEQRSSYKSTILLSEEHYDLLTDLCRDFRKRGFKGHDATISNVMSVGLEIMREALEAEKNLPKP